MKKWFMTTAIPYVNAKPHVGHTLEFVQSDCIARFHRDFLGDEVCLLSGADENALKNVQAAEKVGQDVQVFVDENAVYFQQMAKALDVKIDIFQKGSDIKTHIPSSQKLWNLCQEKGDIYKKVYTGLYCVGCEAFYTKDELNENGECFEHPGRPLETVSEENYFFKLSSYQKIILDLIQTDTLKIIPETKKNEIVSFLEKEELQDISISRTNERAKNWGVPVPGDDSQRMYVWFDALNIYQSGVGFGWNEELYRKWWPADVHVIGKGITRFHAVYWPAFLLSAGLQLPKSLFVHGYFTVNGQKMSKTLGNVIDPVEIAQKYGSEAFRYYLLREIPAYSDGDFSEERFTQLYNADLANGLGNLVSRVAKLAADMKLSLNTVEKRENRIIKEIIPLLEKYQFNLALEYIWKVITEVNLYIDRERPWQQELSERSKTLSNIIIGTESLASLIEIAESLSPFLPQTSQKIQTLFASDSDFMLDAPLFQRLQTA